MINYVNRKQVQGSKTPLEISYKLTLTTESANNADKILLPTFFPRII